jgi:thioredoxin-like negative regulator of GroEL
VLEEWKSTSKRIRKTEPFRLVAMALDKAGDSRRADLIFREGLNCPRANTHILADYIDFLDKEGRREEAIKLLANLDEQSPNLQQRKREIAVRMGVTAESLPEVPSRIVSANAESDDEDSADERRRVRLARRGKEIWTSKTDAAAPQQKLTREQREERRRARREGTARPEA